MDRDGSPGGAAVPLTAEIEYVWKPHCHYLLELDEVHRFTRLA